MLSKIVVICSSGAIGSLCRVLLLYSSSAADLNVAGTVSRIANVERRLPWLWSPSAEGLADIPYTYDVRMTRRITNRAGKDVPLEGRGDGLSNWRAIHLQRVPLEWGSHLKCLSQDGQSPCPKVWEQELDRQAKSRDSLTQEERERIDRTREERRRRRRSFWDHFPTSLLFESAGVGQIRFNPRAGSKGMLNAIQGRLWFDSTTHEITRMEYHLTRDVEEPLVRLLKGSHFEIELSRSGDHYFPARTTVRRPLKGGDVEERVTSYSEFRRFETESRIQFTDPQN